MSKSLKARKVKDGWLIIVEITSFELTKSDVLKRIRYEGLIIRKDLSNDKDSIYAD